MMIGGRKAAAPYRPHTSVLACVAMYGAAAFLPPAIFFNAAAPHTKSGTMRTFFVKINKKCLKNVVYVEFLW